MTSYELDYTDDADNQLSDIWLASADRNGVTRALKRIDQLLRSDPHSGQYLIEGLWKKGIFPLAAFYEIDGAGFQVTICNFEVMGLEDLDWVAVKESSDRTVDLLRLAGIHCSQRIVMRPDSRPIYAIAVPAENFGQAERLMEQAQTRQNEDFARTLRYIRQPFAARDMLFAREPNDGYYESFAWAGEAFDETRFKLVPRGWDHEHCHLCWAKVEPGDEWWTTQPPNYHGPIGLCLECYSRLFEITPPRENPESNPSDY